MDLSFHFFGSIQNSPERNSKSWLPTSEDMLTWPEKHEASASLTLRTGQRCLIIRRDESIAILRGYIAGQGPTDKSSQRTLLAQLLDRFIDREDLKLARLDGSFTLLFATTNQPRLMIFRNLVGNTFTYYQPTKQGLRFGSQLAELVRSNSYNVSLNRSALPLYFIYRFTPGSETLFEGVKRLMPGEQLLYQQGQLRVEQLQTFRDLVQPEKIKTVPAAIESVESTMANISQDHMDFYPNAAGLLSGGVDSSYIQAHWNQKWKNREESGKPRSAAFWLNDTKRETDRDYTTSAVDVFNTDHISVQIDQLNPSNFRETLQDSGEMPNHVQSFYFRCLAREMRRNGATAGLCGEGADGLFGTDDIPFMIKANRVKCQLPNRFLRHSAAVAAKIIGKPYRAEAIRFADHLHDLEKWEHPINSNAAFTDWDDLTSCFGGASVQKALNDRRNLLSVNQVPDDPLHLQHILTIGFLGEAVNTAAYWTAMFNSEGIDMLCPFLDTRMLRATLNIQTNIKFPKQGSKVILKKALSQYVPMEFVRRPKRGFGQPIIKWMGRGGPLHPLVEDIDDYDFLPSGLLEKIANQPNWFLYNLLVFDIWHKNFFQSP